MNQPFRNKTPEGVYSDTGKKISQWKKPRQDNPSVDCERLKRRAAGTEPKQ